MSNPSELFSPFLPTTYNVPEEEDRRKSFLVDNFSTMADVINDKKIGAYTQATESFNGNKFSYDTTSKVRNGYQALVRIKSYPNTGVMTVSPPMDINPQFVVSNMWGSASKPPTKTGAGDGNYFTFQSSGNPLISFTMTDMAIVITTTADLSAYSGFIIIEYIRDGM